MISCSSHVFNKTNFEKYLFKNDIEKKLQNFPHCFLATQSRSIRANKKEPHKIWQRATGCPSLLLNVGKTRARESGGQSPQTTTCVFQNPCWFYLKSFISLALIGQLVWSSKKVEFGVHWGFSERILPSNYVQVFVSLLSSDMKRATP